METFERRNNMNAHTIWQNSQSEIKENINKVGYNVYIKDIIPVSIENDTLNLSVSMNINKNMIEKRYTDVIEAAVTHSAGYSLKINVSVNANPEEVKSSISEKEDETEESGFKSINKKYTFDTFVIGASNEYAHAASLRTAKNPGKINPLFLYGNSGLGKTHLMCAIGNYILQQNKNCNIIYVSSEKFTNNFILQNKNLK